MTACWCAGSILEVPVIDKVLTRATLTKGIFLLILQVFFTSLFEDSVLNSIVPEPDQNCRLAAI